MPNLPDYMNDVVDEMQRKSDAIRRDYTSHRPSAGTNREELVENFLRGHLPRRFGIEKGIIFSHDGKLSRQADLMVVDDQNNAPLYPSHTTKLWPVEAVYALIEVKTRLDPSDLQDAIDKGRRFKRLRRDYCDTGSLQRIEDLLFVIWSFESANPKKLKEHLVNAICGVPCSEQPDLVVVPHKLVATSGKYLELSKNDQHYMSIVLREPVEVYASGHDSLLVWYIFFDSWLRQAGPRFVDPVRYLPPERIYGRMV